MGKVSFYTCDHCGKRLDEMKDYPESGLDVCYDYISCDLCADCVLELSKLVRGYVKKEKDGDGNG